MRPPVSMLAQLAQQAQQPTSMALHLHQPSTLLLSLQPSLLSPETTLAPLSEPWVQALVWDDFRIAVAFFVVAPLALLAASVAARVPPAAGALDERSDSAETVLRLMTSYWQASSLLLLTVLLDIQEVKFCVVAGLAAQAMIFVSLW